MGNGAFTAFVERYGRMLDPKENFGGPTAAPRIPQRHKKTLNQWLYKHAVRPQNPLPKPKENFWKQKRSGARERYDLAQWLILLALLWFVLDVAFRRFCFKKTLNQWLYKHAVRPQNPLPKSAMTDFSDPSF